MGRRSMRPRSRATQGKPLIEVNGSGTGSTGWHSHQRHGRDHPQMIIDHFKGSGILVLGKGGNRIAGNYIGTDASGTVDAGDTAHGILLQSPNNIIGETALGMAATSAATT